MSEEQAVAAQIVELTAHRDKLEAEQARLPDLEETRLKMDANVDYCMLAVLLATFYALVWFVFGDRQVISDWTRFGLLLALVPVWIGQFGKRLGVQYDEAQAVASKLAAIKSRLRTLEWQLATEDQQRQSAEDALRNLFGFVREHESELRERFTADEAAVITLWQDQRPAARPRCQVYCTAHDLEDGVLSFRQEHRRVAHRPEQQSDPAATFRDFLGLTVAETATFVPEVFDTWLHGTGPTASAISLAPDPSTDRGLVRATGVSGSTLQTVSASA